MSKNGQKETHNRWKAHERQQADRTSGKRKPGTLEERLLICVKYVNLHIKWNSFESPLWLFPLGR